MSDAAKAALSVVSAALDYTPVVGFVKGVCHGVSGDYNGANQARERHHKSAEFCLEAAVRLAGAMHDEPDIHGPPYDYASKD